MLLSVRQEPPDSSDESQEQSDSVSEDELDMILATMGTTSLKDSEMAILQDDVEQSAEEVSEAIVRQIEPTEEIEAVAETETGEEKERILEETSLDKPVVGEETTRQKRAPQGMVKKFFRRLKLVK